MSLQGPLIVVADRPATELSGALSAAGAFPIVESTWADAPTAFVAVKPSALVIAESGQPSNETTSRMLCLQIATAAGDRSCRWCPSRSPVTNLPCRSRSRRLAITSV
jgi:hypothetical protein